MEEITITDGYYTQKHFKRKFRVEIYRDQKDGKSCILYPTWVNEPPENWIRIE